MPRRADPSRRSAPLLERNLFLGSKAHFHLGVLARCGLTTNRLRPWRRGRVVSSDYGSSARQLVHQFQSERLGGSSQEIRESGRGDGGSSRPTRQGIANEAQPAAGQHGEPRTRSGASASDRPHRGQAHHRHSVARQRNVDAEPAPAPHWRCQGGGRRAGPERGRWDYVQNARRGTCRFGIR